MKTYERLSLLDALPFPNGLYRNNPVVHPGAEWKDTMYANAISDFGFCWRYVEECVALNIELPSLVTSEAMLDAYWFIKNKVDNRDLCMARVSRTAPRRNSRLKLEACLMDKHRSIEETAKICNLSPKTVTMYEELFFNVRDHFIDDTNYITDKIFPHTGHAQMDPTYFKNIGPEVVSLQLSYWVNSDLALEFLGDIQRGESLPREQHEKLIKDAIMRHASMLARIGHIYHHNPAANAARGMMNAETMSQINGNKTTNVSGFDLGGSNSFVGSVLQSLPKERDKVVFDQCVAFGIARHKATTAEMHANLAREGGARN